MATPRETARESTQVLKHTYIEKSSFTHTSEECHLKMANANAIY